MLHNLLSDKVILDKVDWVDSWVEMIMPHKFQLSRIKSLSSSELLIYNLRPEEL